MPTGSFNDNFGLPDTRVEWQLADGSTVDAPVYVGEVEIVGLPAVRAAITMLGDEYVLGRSVLDHFKVTLDHGRLVTVEP